MDSPLKGKDRYEILDDHIGQGTYGKVEKAKDKITGEIVAIKKVRVEIKDDQQNRQNREIVGNFGIHFTIIREIKIMREIEHQNIMRVLDVYVQGDFMNLVMSHMSSDLKKLMEKTTRLSESQIKCILKQILTGLQVLHSWYFIHRDLSPANIFISDKGICKLADFGLSRTYGWLMKDQSFNKENSKVVWKEYFTDKVVTLWYRPPELILGANKYGSAVDIWSVGCIFAELLREGKALFPGFNEIDQLGKIFEIMGSPSDTNWPEARNLPCYCEFTHCNAKNLKDIFVDRPAVCIDLMEKLLNLNPNKRISAEGALKHEYFSVVPLPCRPEELPLQYL